MSRPSNATESRGVQGPPSHLSKHIRQNIRRLDPSPLDLRQAAAFTLITNKQRFEAIRHGHLHTALHPLPEEMLSEKEIGSRGMGV